MKRAVFLALCIVPFTASCGGGEPEVQPKSGTWGIALKPPSKNTCGKDINFSTGDFLLTANSDGTFTVDPKDGTPVFTCTIDGDSFDCPERTLEPVKNDAVDATITAKISEVGTFTSSTEATGVRYGSADCAGSQCGAAETFLGITFPCEAEAEFVTSHKN